MRLFRFGMLLAVLVAAGLFYFWFQSSLKPVNFSGDTVVFTINSGESANSVAQRLVAQNLIRSKLAARIYLKLNPQQFKPGVYYLKSQSLSQIFAELSKGPKDIKVTFPEGWRREQYAARLQNIFPDFDTNTFLNLTATLEGRLFPDTYFLPASPSPEKVVSILTQNFVKKSGLTERQSDILIIASLIERESNNPADSGLISGIIHKRLKAGWPLQIDATVQYAKDSQDCQNQPLVCQYWKPISDTKFNSLFNTYLHSGLPPSPIANPGLNSINAALHPTNSDYWYYLTGADGKTYFSQNLKDHDLLIDTKLKL